MLNRIVRKGIFTWDYLYFLERPYAYFLGENPSASYGMSLPGPRSRRPAASPRTRPSPSPSSAPPRGEHRTAIRATIGNKTPHDTNHITNEWPMLPFMDEYLCWAFALHQIRLKTFKRHISWSKKRLIEFVQWLKYIFNLTRIRQNLFTGAFIKKHRFWNFDFWFHILTIM